MFRSISQPNYRSNVENRHEKERSTPQKNGGQKDQIEIGVDNEKYIASIPGAVERDEGTPTIRIHPVQQWMCRHDNERNTEMPPERHGWFSSFPGDPGHHHREHQR